MRNPNPRQRKRKLGLGREMRRIPGNRKKDKKGEAEPPQGRRWTSPRLYDWFQKKKTQKNNRNYK